MTFAPPAAMWASVVEKKAPALRGVGAKVCKTGIGIAWLVKLNLSCYAARDELGAWYGQWRT